MMSLYSKLNFDLSLNKQHKSILKLVIANKESPFVGLSEGPFIVQVEDKHHHRLHDL